MRHCVAVAAVALEVPDRLDAAAAVNMFVRGLVFCREGCMCLLHCASHAFVSSAATRIVDERMGSYMLYVCVYVCAWELGALRRADV